MSLDTSKPIASVKYNGVDVPLHHPVVVFDPNDAIALLWTNPNPTVYFDAQTVSLPGADCTGYLVEYEASVTDSESPYTMIAYLSKGVPITLTTLTDNDALTKRTVTAVTDTGITFDTGYWGQNTTPDYCIPTRIWGVHFTL